MRRGGFPFARIAAALLVLSARVLAAAQPPATAAATRPLVRDDAGAVVSRLVIPDGIAKVTIPLVEEDGLFMTDAMRVNGRAVGWVVVDTGASFSALDREAARAAGLEPGQRLPTERDDVERPDGFYPLASLAVADLRFENHTIVVADLSSLRRPGRRAIAGVIGGDVLGATPFTIDVRRGELVLHARASFSPPAGIEARRIVLDGKSQPNTVYDRANPHAGAPVVRAAINDVRSEAVLDTGFAGSVVLLPRLTRAHPKWVVPGERPAARAAGAGGGMGLAGREMSRAKVNSIRVLGVTFVKIATALALDGEEPAGPPRDAVVGAEILSHLRLTFDYAERRVWAEYNPRQARP